MSEKTHHRRPATFKLDDPGVIVMDPEDAGRPARGTVQITPEADPAQLPVPLDTPLLEHGTTEEPSLPHIRLDRALQFLIGDRLQ